MKNYYNLPKAIQWIIAIGLLILGGVIIAPIITSPYGLLSIPFIAPFLNLVSVPICRLVGYYKYLNPYVLSTIQTDKHYDLHNIFTFDYLVNFKWSDRGRNVQKILLTSYFKALLTIIDRIENEGLSPDVLIVGHSYFFSNRTAEKLGFRVSKASFFWIFNSVIQFIELSLLYSFSKGKLALPKFWKVQRAEILGSELVKKKKTLEKLVDKLERQVNPERETSPS